MKLRNHPLMSFQGVGNWPPDWKLSFGTSSVPPTGEVGMLDRVPTSTTDPCLCFIMMLHEGRYYIGELKFDDDEFCRQICELLNANLGLSLRDIGSLDIP